jgi:hypothetical protein
MFCGRYNQKPTVASCLRDRTLFILEMDCKLRDGGQIRLQNCTRGSNQGIQSCALAMQLKTRRQVRLDSFKPPNPASGLV